MQLVVNNSFSRIEGQSPHIDTFISKVLTYEKMIKPELDSLIFRLKQVNWKIKKYNGVNQEEFDKANKEKWDINQQIKKLKANRFVCWYRKGVFPTGHLNIVKKALEHLKQEYDLIDNRKIPDKTVFYKWNNRPFKPRNYQKEAIESAIKEHRGVIESAVGTGKSLMQAYIIKELGVKTLIIVPSTGLSDQMYQDFKDWFGINKVEIVNTKSVRSGKELKPIRLITIQSLSSLKKSKELEHLIKDVDCIIGDEFHHAGSNSYTQLFPDFNHIYHRYGFTGTFLRNGGDELDLYGFLSTVIYRYKAHQAISDGFLTPIQKVIHEIPGVKKGSYHKEYDENYCGNEDLMYRILEISQAMVGKQLLILVSKKDKSGHLINEYLKVNGVDSTFISGDNKKEEITKTISDFNNKKIQILIGSSVIGEGIDIRSADGLVLAQGGKSEIAIVQAIGRLVRLYDGKLRGYLHDFKFTGTKYMNKHYNMRSKIIESNFSPEKDIIWENFK